MLKIDKVKIIAPANCIANLDYNYFETKVKKDEVTLEEFSAKTPSLLKIKRVDNIKCRELSIEFTAKILKDNYPQLIHKDNFKQCLCIINDMGLCTLDIDRIYNEGYFTKVDITQDVCYKDEYLGLIQNMKGGVCNFNKYNTTSKRNGNFIIEKNVSTRQRKKRLTIYQKHRELLLSDNKPFLASLTDSEKLLKYFQDIIRFELNLTSLYQIRESLHISDTSIDAVLSSTATPILDFIDAVFLDTTANIIYNDKREYELKAVLEVNDYDLEKVEAVMRSFPSTNKHISQAMKPYRELFAKIRNAPGLSIKQSLNDMLH